MKICMRYLAILALLTPGFLLLPTDAFAGAPYNAQISIQTSNLADYTITVHTYVFECNDFSSEGPRYTVTVVADCMAHGGLRDVLSVSATVDLVLTSGPGRLNSSTVQTNASTGDGQATYHTDISGTAVFAAYYSGDHSSPRATQSMQVGNPLMDPTPAAQTPASTTSNAPTPKPAATTSKATPTPIAKASPSVSPAASASTTTKSKPKPTPTPVATLARATPVAQYQTAFVAILAVILAGALWFRFRPRKK